MNAPTHAQKTLLNQQQPTLPASRESRVDSSRWIATLVGVLFIIGTVAGMASAVITGPLLGGSDYLAKVAASAGQVRLAALLVLLMGIALALIPALMFPILRKLSEPLAIAYVIFRGALETMTTIGTVVCWLLLVAVTRQHADLGSVSQVGSLGILLVEALDPISAVLSIVFSLGALMLYYLLYQARLIPRWISGWGIVAAVLYLVAGLTALFGIDLEMLMYVMLPQEMVMAVWLIAKGFSPSAIASITRTEHNEGEA
jgi:hypothetical protein